jgi:hypothetical protein
MLQPGETNVMSTIDPTSPPVHLSTTKTWLAYKVGDKDSSGVEILKIIHRDEKGMIYWIHGDKMPHNLKWEVEDNIGAHWNRSTSATRNLLAPVKKVMKDGDDRDTALMMLAAGLAMALKANPPDVEQDYLIDAAIYIRDRQREILQIRYFMASVVTAVAISVFALLIGVILIRSGLFDKTVTVYVIEFSLAALLGGAGAMISVSQRFRSIEVERYMSRKLATIGGCSRIVFGCWFGAVFLLFHKAGLVLSVANEHPWLLAAAALVSGFSERIIPEVLAQFERQIYVSKNKNRIRANRHDLTKSLRVASSRTN